LNTDIPILSAIALQPDNVAVVACVITSDNSISSSISSCPSHERTNKLSTKKINSKSNSTETTPELTTLPLPLPLPSMSQTNITNSKCTSDIVLTTAHEPFNVITTIAERTKKRKLPNLLHMKK
jgi:hypothetical protein